MALAEEIRGALRAGPRLVHPASADIVVDRRTGAAAWPSPGGQRGLNLTVRPELR